MTEHWKLVKEISDELYGDDNALALILYGSLLYSWSFITLPCC